MFKNKQVIVTGGAGFIGSSLVKALLEQGAHVRVIDNLWRGRLENLPQTKDGEVVREVDVCVQDLTDYANCLDLIRDADYVYHLADVVAGINFVFDNEAFIFRQNVLINSNTLAACIANEIPNYIYVGTACSFPKHLQMVDEVARLREDQTYPAHPESSYGWSKLMGEYEAELAMKSGKINVGLLRFHNVYGPGASYEPARSQVIPSLIRKAVNYPDEDYVVWGSGNQYRDFVYIDDVVSALLLVAEKGMNQGLIQIGTGEPVSIRQVAEQIAKIADKGIEPVFDTSAPEGDRGRVGVCDRANKILNWTPTTTIEEGLRQTWDWIELQIENRRKTNLSRLR